MLMIILLTIFISEHRYLIIIFAFPLNNIIMKNYLLSLLLFITGITVYAQQSSSIAVSGQIVDSLSREPVLYANVKIFHEQQKTNPMKVVASDENGNFSIELKDPGNYILAVEYIGKKPVYKPFSAETGQNIDMGKVEMSENTQLLKEITVTAQRPLVKVDLDKITYDMEEDPESKTNNVLEMLKKVPMVTVDGEENIQVKGSSNFKFYINGKPSNMLSNNPKDVLRSIPANTVKNVEVITEPGAKYDAEGVAGIINIVMQSQSSLGGYTVSLNASASSMGQVGGGSYFSVKYGKVGLTGNLNYFNISQPKITYSTFRENFTTNTNRFLTQDGSSKTKAHFLMGYGELSYEIDTLNLINVNVSSRGINISSNQFIDIIMRNSNNEESYKYEQNSSIKSVQPGITLGADYQRTFSLKDRLLTVSYKLDTYNSDQNTLSQINPLLNYTKSQNRQINNSESYEHTYQLDYTTPIAKIHTVEAGVKFIKRVNKSNSGISMSFENDNWIDIPSYNNEFSHVQDIWAAYAGHNLRYKKWGVKTGLRYEGTQLNVKYPLNNAQNFDAGYSSLIPSITATYMLKPNKTLRGGYNLRIQRPGISYLNPYINSIDSNYISYGNPELDVVKYHNINLNYNMFKPKFTMNANLSYGFTNEGISNFTWMDGYVSKTSYFNLLNEKRLNLSSYLNWTPTPKLRLFGNLGGSYINLYSNMNKTLKNSGFAGNIYGGAQYSFPKDFVLNLNGSGNTPYITLQRKSMSYYYYNISASKSFLNKKLNIRLSATNLFKDKLKFIQTTESNDFYQKTIYLEPFRQFSINVSYRFGEMKAQIKKAQRTIRNEDQMQGESSNSSGSSTGVAAPQ